MTSQTPAVATQGVTPVSAAVMEQVVINGDLDKLSAQDRVAYYKRVCESVGVNPFTRPFQYIRLNGKLTLYAAKDCTEQLRAQRGISITGLAATFDKDAAVYTVIATAIDREGRTDSATGAVPLGNEVKGEARANAIMKAETRGVRRQNKWDKRGAFKACNLDANRLRQFSDLPTSVRLDSFASPPVSSPVWRLAVRGTCPPA